MEELLSALENVNCTFSDYVFFLLDKYSWFLETIFGVIVSFMGSSFLCVSMTSLNIAPELRMTPEGACNVQNDICLDT